jgi:hypothetical protein
MDLHRRPTLESRCVIVAGIPRSGSSWLGKGLSYAPGFTYYREPDNPHAVAEAEERFSLLYLTPEQNDSAYLRLMTRAIAGEIATTFTMSDDPGPLLKHLGTRGLKLGERFPSLYRRKRHVLLKLVYANLNLTWLSARFPRAQQAYVLRHPCGQFDSWRRLGWEPQPAELLANERLMADHLHPFRHQLKSANGYWERAGALWGAMTYVVHRQTEGAGGRLIIAYEWLCRDPVARFQEMYRALGLEWSRKAERFLRSSDRAGDTSPYSLNRPSERQVDEWRERVSREEIEACRRFVEPFGLPYYPEFEPGVTSIKGDRTDSA